MSDILFVHNNFPAQFGFVAEALVARGHRCAAVTSKTGQAIDGVSVVRWQSRRGSTPGILKEATRIEADLIRGGGAARAALALKQKGFDPAVIIGHPGWGETSYMRELFPNARQIVYAEYYYRSKGGDVGFDPEFPQPSDMPDYVLAAKNAGMAMAFAEADRIVAPTPFQYSLLPDTFKARTSIIHEGVDTDYVVPRSGLGFKLRGGRVLDASTPIITFINRRFEPLRGYHIFMRALPKLMAAVPEAEVLLIGADEPGGYGRPADQGQTWGRHFLDEVRDRIDVKRLHFTGRVPHEVMLGALSISAAHVYLTYPFVMSWSLLEALASECLVIGSDTPPVRDAIAHGKNGILVDFFDYDGLADALIEACRSPGKFSRLRTAARKSVLKTYDRKTVCIPAWMDLVDGLLA